MYEFIKGFMLLLKEPEYLFRPGESTVSLQDTYNETLQMLAQRNSPSLMYYQT